MNRAIGIIFVALGLFCGFALIGCNRPPADDKRQTASDRPAVKDVPNDSSSAEKMPAIVLAHETSLWNEYGDNVVAADLKYTNKAVEISLLRGSAEKDASGQYYIGCQIAEPVLPGVTPGMYCYVTLDSLTRLAKAKPNQAFAIRGTCKGKESDRTAYKGYRVTLVNCEVLHVLTWNGQAWKEDD